MSAQPSHAALEAFGVTETPHRLPGGQGTTYRAGSMYSEVIQPYASDARHIG